MVWRWWSKPAQAVAILYSKKTKECLDMKKKLNSTPRLNLIFLLNWTFFVQSLYNTSQIFSFRTQLENKGSHQATQKYSIMYLFGAMKELEPYFSILSSLPTKFCKRLLKCFVIEQIAFKTKHFISHLCNFVWRLNKIEK